MPTAGDPEPYKNVKLLGSEVFLGGLEGVSQGKTGQKRLINLVSGRYWGRLAD